MPNGGRLQIQTEAYVVRDPFLDRFQQVYPARRKEDPMEANYFHLRKPDPLAAIFTKFSKGDRLVRIRISDTGIGIKKEDLDIEVMPDSVHLQAEVKREHEEGGKEQTFHRRELVWQRFERTIPLPTQVKTEDVKAKLENGLLEIHLPKAEETKAKTRKVQVD